MKRFARVIVAILKFGMPLSLLLVPVLAIYGWITPWAPIQPALERYSDQTPILVGTSYEARHTNSGSTVSASRSYILLPSVLNDPQLVTFSQVNSKPVIVIRSRGALALMISWWAVCMFGTWWFWIRRTPSNHSFKSNPSQGST